MPNRSTAQTVALIICAILLPPVAVGIVRGLTLSVLLNVLLCLLFYVPAQIHAVYVVVKG